MWKWLFSVFTRRKSKVGVIVEREEVGKNIGNDEERDNIDEIEEENGDAFDEKVPTDDNLVQMDQNKENEKEEDGPASSFYDPPLPKVGVPVNIGLLLERNEKAQVGMETLFELIFKDVEASKKDATTIPVSEDIDRVKVTEEISKRMAMSRTRQDLLDAGQSSINEIQKCLNYRRSALLMMNTNYSKKQVRRVEPIYMVEARTLITLK